MMKIIKGDLISFAEEGLFDVIVHGCNCLCNMGSGIARTIRDSYPEVYDFDCKTTRGDKEKLGDYTSVSVGHRNRFTVVNAYTQYAYSRDKVDVDYNAVRSVFKLIKRDFSRLRIGYPLIGAGLAGGDWSIIASIVDEELTGEEHTLVEFEK